jgi:hypothetical protein
MAGRQSSAREGDPMPGFEVLYQAAALCLMYPDDDFRARLPLLREAAPQLREFADHAAVTPPMELAAHYVEVFEAGQEHSLYLSAWREAAPAPSAWRPPARSRRTSCPPSWSSPPAPAATGS